MPIYEYQCSFCNHQLETMQKISEDPLKDCPACRKPGLIKLVSAAGFQLKGTGWYITDYSAKGKVKSAQENKPAENKPAENNAAETKPTETKTTDSKAADKNS